MRLLIILGLAASLSAVSCKPPQAHRREHGSSRRYKDYKNKRGIGDYPFGLSYGGTPYQGYQSSLPSAPVFGHGIQSFADYNGLSAGFGGHNLLGLSSLGSYGAGFGQGLSLGSQGSSYSLPASSSNLASLLSGSSQTGGSYSSGSPMSFSSQSSGQMQQYTPMYASSSPLGSASSGSAGHSSPQASSGHLQPYSLPSSAGLGLPIASSLSSGGGLGYGAPSVLGDSHAAHSIGGAYLVQPPGAGSSASYSFPVSSALTSSPSSPRYTVSIPPSSYSSASSAAGSGASGSHGSGSSAYQLSSSSSSPPPPPPPPSSSASSHQASLQAALQGLITRYTPDSGAMKLAMVSLASPNSYRSASSQPQAYSYQLAVPNYSGDSESKLQQQQNSVQLLTSYGTPAMGYALPSTSYGTPTSHQYMISSSNAPGLSSSSSSASSSSSSSSSPSSLSNGHAPATSSYTSSAPVNSYGMSTSLSYQADSAYKNSASSSSSSGYEPMSTGEDSNSIINYRSPDDYAGDLSSAYSSLAPRYMRYSGGRSYGAGPYADADVGSSSYDTISYSVPSGKY